MRLLRPLRVSAVNLPRSALARAISLLGVSACAVVLAPASSFAGPTESISASRKASVLLRDGRWIDGDITLLDERTIEIAAQPSKLDSAISFAVKRSDLIACLPGGPLRGLGFLTQASGSSLVFADGQLIPGILRCATDGCLLEHRWLGSVAIDVDRLSEVRVVATRRAASRADADTVLLANGDAVSGFVEAIAAEVILESADEAASSKDGDPQGAKNDPSGGGANAETALRRAPAITRRLGIERVAAISFATVERPPIDRPMVWTSDGTTVRVEGVRFETGRGWSFTPSNADIGASRESAAVSESVARPLAFLLDPSAFIALSSCGDPTIAAPSSSYRFERSPQVRIDPPEHALLGLGSIRIAGPMTLRFPLESNRFTQGDQFVFSATVSLLEPAPDDARVEVEIRFGDESTGILTLDRANPTAAIRLAAAVRAGATLELRVEDGGNGIAGDRIALDRACFIRQR